MSRTVYVNGEYLPEENAKISIFDRGFLFADSIYEVSAVLGGHLVDLPGHIARMNRSLSELRISRPCSNDELIGILKEIIRMNKVEEGKVYWQVTRGIAERQFPFPREAHPSLVVFSMSTPTIPNASMTSGIAVSMQPDIRWGRRDIKTTQLLPNCLAVQAAVDAGAQSAWLVENGHVTEGESNNAWIVQDDGVVVTRDLSRGILAGVTRQSVLRLAEQAGIRFEERAFTPEEARTAAEAFVTSATRFVTPVVKIDEHVIGSGVPGPITLKMQEILVNEGKTAQ